MRFDELMNRRRNVPADPLTARDLREVARTSGKTDANAFLSTSFSPNFTFQPKIPQELTLL